MIFSKVFSQSIVIIVAESCMYIYSSSGSGIYTFYKLLDVKHFCLQRYRIYIASVENVSSFEVHLILTFLFTVQSKVIFFTISGPEVSK